jgi:DNA-binding CsgD family transcriptional regulator
MQQTRLASAAVTFRAALELQWETRDLLRVANTLCDYTECLHRLGQLEETIDVCLAGVTRLGELGLASHFENGVILGNAAYSALKLGRTAQAAELYNTAGSYLAGDLGLVSAPLYLSRGELSQAEGLLTGGEDFGPSVEYARFYLENRAELQLLQGREREAAATALRGLAVVAGTPEEPCAGRLLLLGMRALADQSYRLRAAGRADELADVTAAVAELTATGLSLPSGPIGEAAAEEVVTTAAVRAQWAAECSRLGGGSDEALWELAAAEWHRLGRPHPAAYCELRRAEALAQRRAPRALLAEVLRTSFRMASGLQAQPLIDEARSLAVRARIPLTDGQPSDTASKAEELRSYGLTEREMEVLALLERGMTNQQIAQTLFISKGTTSIHLSHIFTKLGVNSRTQAALLARAARPT